METSYDFLAGGGRIRNPHHARRDAWGELDSAWALLSAAENEGRALNTTELRRVKMLRANAAIVLANAGVDSAEIEIAAEIEPVHSRAATYNETAARIEASASGRALTIKERADIHGLREKAAQHEQTARLLEEFRILRHRAQSPLRAA